jgi:hypothetical protein
VIIAAANKNLRIATLLNTVITEQLSPVNLNQSLSRGGPAKTKRRGKIPRR